LPIDGFSREDFIMAGEGVDACYLYLAQRRLPAGNRQFGIFGLDVMSDLPESNALLDGIIEYLLQR